MYISYLVLSIIVLVFMSIGATIGILIAGLCVAAKGDNHE